MTTYDHPLDPAGSAPLPGDPLRPPGEGECELCGFTPATRATFQSLTSVVIFYSVGTRQGWMCRSCGLATYRALVGRTLVAGWWGVGVFAMPIILLINRLRLRRVLQLPPPQGRLQEVAPAVPAPIDPGKRIMARGSGIFATTLCVLALLFVLLGVLTG